MGWEEFPLSVGHTNTCARASSKVHRVVRITPTPLLQVVVMDYVAALTSFRVFLANVVDPFEQLLFRSNINQS